jgi:hypothetical protein
MRAGSKQSQGSGNRTKHHGFGKSFALVSNSLRSLKIIILDEVAIPVLNIKLDYIRQSAWLLKLHGGYASVAAV